MPVSEWGLAILFELKSYDAGFKVRKYRKTYALVWCLKIKGFEPVRA
jgi:hypothetical protein